MKTDIPVENEKLEEYQLRRLYNVDFRKAYDSEDKKEAIRIVGQNHGLIDYLSHEETTKLFRAVLETALDTMINPSNKEEPWDLGDDE